MSDTATTTKTITEEVIKKVGGLDHDVERILGGYFQAPSYGRNPHAVLLQISQIVRGAKQEARDFMLKFDRASYERDQALDQILTAYGEEARDGA